MFRNVQKRLDMTVHRSKNKYKDTEIYLSLYVDNTICIKISWVYVCRN